MRSSALPQTQTTVNYTLNSVEQFVFQMPVASGSALEVAFCIKCTYVCEYACVCNAFTSYISLVY